jgi:hypothetical protein
MGNSNTPFAMKSCACASISFLAGIISLTVDYNSRVAGADCLLFAFVCCVVSMLTWKLNFCSRWNSGAKLIDRRNYLSVLVASVRELIVVTGTVNFLMCWRLNTRSWPSKLIFLNDVRNHDSGFRLGLEGLALVTLPCGRSLLLCHS